MTSNVRVDIIIQRLDRIESKIDEQRRELAESLEAHRRDTAAAVERLHGRVNKTNERVSKTESRVARVEVIGGLFGTVWSSLIGWLFQGR